MTENSKGSSFPTMLRMHHHLNALQLPTEMKQEENA